MNDNELYDLILQINNNYQLEFNSLDDEMKYILERFKDWFIDMNYHNWNDNSEIYSGITYGNFKRIYAELLNKVKEITL